MCAKEDLYAVGACLMMTDMATDDQSGLVATSVGSRPLQILRYSYNNPSQGTTTGTNFCIWPAPSY